MFQVKSVITVVIFCILCACTASAEESYGDVVVSRLLRVYDGDTVFIDIDSYPPIVGKNISVRINGIDAPEMRAACSKERSLARDAKHVLEGYLRGAEEIKLVSIQRDKYFRILADVYIDKINVVKIMLQPQIVVPYTLRQQIVVPYSGGTKTKDWCN